MSAIFSTEALKHELEATIQLVQGALEDFSENSTDVARLQNVADLTGQLRGIFKVLEERGATALCDEMGAAIDRLLQLTAPALEAERLKILEAMSQTLMILNRFLDLLNLQKKTIPAVLLPAINTLRVASGHAALSEAYFFDFSPPENIVPPGKVTPLAQHTSKQLKKFRQMYQAGLAHLIRGDSTRGAIRYMTLALSRVTQVLGKVPGAAPYWVAASALESMITTDASFSAERKRVLASVDREMKQLINGLPASVKQPTSSNLLKELLFLVALGRADSQSARQIRQMYRVPELNYDETSLQEQRQLLFSPGKGVLASVAEALTDDINALKDAVDQLARGGQLESKGLHLQLAKVADVFLMLGLKSPANVLKVQADQISNWPNNAAPTQDELLKIADVILYAESALSRLRQGQSQLGDGVDNKAFKVEVNDARVVLIDESENGLALAKRSISAYVDSGGDKLHLAKVVGTLDGVRGALIFLDGTDAAAVVARVIVFVERELLEKGTLIDAEQLELFADALSSLEFYLEGLLSNNENLDILELALSSLDTLSV